MSRKCANSRIAKISQLRGWLKCCYKFAFANDRWLIGEKINRHKKTSVFKAGFSVSLWGVGSFRYDTFPLILRTLGIYH